jgi:hypothetical protein
MVEAQGRNAGTQPTPVPAPKLSRAAKAARTKAAKQVKQAAKAAQKAAKDAEKAAKAEAKAAKTAARAAAKTAKAAAKAAKVAKAARKTAKSAKAGKSVKSAKSAKTNKRPAKRAKAPGAKSSTKATKAVTSTAIPHTVQVPTQAQTPGFGEESDSDSESDSESDSDPDSDSDEEREPQAKRQKTGSPTFDQASNIPPFMDLPPVPKSKVQVQIGEWDYTKQLFVPPKIKDNVKVKLPKIYIGGSAPWPRWVVTRSETIPEPGKPPAARADYTGVQWTLDEGHFTYWGRLDYPVLYELAWECFEYMMTDAALRNEIYASLAQGPLSATVTLGQNWHPALPKIPFTTHFGKGVIEKLKLRSSDDMAYYFDDYARPPVAVRPAGGVTLPFDHVISNKLYNQPRGKWPTAPRSPSPELERQSDSESDSQDSESDSRDSDGDKQDSKGDNQDGRGDRQDSEGDSQDSEESSEEESNSDSSRRSSIAVEQSSLAGFSERQQEPAAPIPLGNDESFARASEYFAPKGHLS